jgi:hypothetical protein
VLAGRLAETVPDLSCWDSRDETDPIAWMD